MENQNIFNDALNLKPAEKLLLIEALAKSLSESNEEIDAQWRIEAEKRFNDFRKGNSKTISYDKILSKWK